MLAALVWGGTFTAIPAVLQAALLAWLPALASVLTVAAALIVLAARRTFPDRSPAPAAVAA
ncbi:hypothetical protein Ani05nite_29010 [Amorphoplanes nipponensis]|uniref:Uncharacterized protein n=1 Tax=Actinoplanes nipponensis TaxID=135950 RepID=A0A919JH27_9ACTN|nr:hypothetical protein Ani05nite_29010 [Actinoplanes nipponensis]